MAVLEIIQGSRSDAALAEKLAGTQAKINAIVRKELQSEFPKGPSMALLELIVGAVRGLSIQRVLTPEDEGVNGAIPLLQDLIGLGVEAGSFGKAAGAGPERKSGANPGAGAGEIVAPRSAKG